MVVTPLLSIMNCWAYLAPHSLPSRPSLSPLPFLDRNWSRSIPAWVVFSSHKMSQVYKQILGTILRCSGYPGVHSTSKCGNKLIQWVHALISSSTWCWQYLHWHGGSYPVATSLAMYFNSVCWYFLQIMISNKITYLISSDKKWSSYCKWESLGGSTCIKNYTKSTCTCSVHHEKASPTWSLCAYQCYAHYPPIG